MGEPKPKPKPKPDVGSSSGASSSSSKISATVLSGGDRRLLKVELLEDETTFVSWKKLMKVDDKDINGISELVLNPNLESRLAPGQPAEGEKVEQPLTNRLSSVIGKIEGFYVGRDSSDGEMSDGIRDDNQYDTDDSFIDDAELDDYFEVDDSAIKHDGFFINRGKLERIEPSATSNQKSKKRQRKESAKPNGKAVDVSNKQAKVAKTVGGKDQQTASRPPLKKKFNNMKTIQDSSSLFEIVKHSDKVNSQSRSATSPKSKAAVSSGALPPKPSNKSIQQQSNSLPEKSRQIGSAKSIVVTKIDSNGVRDIENSAGSRKSVQITKKGGSSVRPKISTLEKAIRELEKVAAESRPSATPENQDADTSSQAVKRRLPRDVKLKLAKVARIAANQGSIHASQGNISGDLIKRLMSIVGHLIQVRSLKRNLKIMIDSGDSANREKDIRFQRIKNEVIEILKTQVPLMESQATNQEAGTSDDFQDAGSVEKPPVKAKYVMDAALEDKLCDLYDIFVDGLEEDAGPQIRKLYANLAELWPNKLMDNHEIKRAICRAKERRRELRENLGKEMDQTKMTKRKGTQSVPKSDGTANPDKASSVEIKTVDVPTATTTSSLHIPPKDQSKMTKRKQTQSVPKSDGTANLDKASNVEDKTVGVPTATTTSSLHNQPTTDSPRDKSKQQHEKLKGTTSSSSSLSAVAKTIRKKTEPGQEESHAFIDKPLVLALRHPHAKTQTQSEAPPDLNLPS